MRHAQTRKILQSRHDCASSCTLVSNQIQLFVAEEKKNEKTHLDTVKPLFVLLRPDPLRIGLYLSHIVLVVLSPRDRRAGHI